MAVLWAFGFGLPLALASTYFSQTVTDAYYAGNTDQGKIIVYAGSDTDVSSTVIRLSSTYGSQTGGGRWYHCTAGGINCTSSASIEISSDSYSLTSTETSYTYTFSSTSFTAGEYYAFVPQRGTYNQDFRVYGAHSDQTADEACIQVASGDCLSTGTGVADPYIIINGAGTDTIVFTNPTDSESKANDFSAWQFDYTLANATTSTDIWYAVDIDYVASSTGHTYHETINSYIPAEGQESGSILTYKNFLLSPDTYNATSTFYSIDLNDCPLPYGQCGLFSEFASTTLATDNITFSTGGLASYFEDTYNSTSTISNLNATCDQASGLFATSICKVLITLFVPSQDALDQFDGIADLIKQKPPAGYFVALNTELTDYASGTASAAFSFNSAIEDFAPLVTLSEALEWLLWLAFGFWLIHRARHFDFHL